MNESARLIACVLLVLLGLHFTVGSKVSFIYNYSSMKNH